MKIWKTIAALALAAAITAISAWADEEIDTGPAMTAAQAWLGTVDAGRNAQSWDDAAVFFRDSVTKVQWQSALDAARGPLGPVVARKLRSANYAHTLPGAPEGDYVVIQVDTRFENRPLSIETVTPMREKDGSWKVAGYFIN